MMMENGSLKQFFGGGALWELAGRKNSKIGRIKLNIELKIEVLKASWSFSVAV